jgi:multicomponent Na+:H+ antiporter subunit E
MKISGFLFSIIFMFALWLGLTGSFATDELLTGLLCAVVVSFFTGNLFSRRGLRHFTPIGLLKRLQFFIVFFKELIVANIDVAKRVLSPSLPIKPGIVKIKTKLTDDMDKLWLANSITLTPGTLTMEINEDNLYIHWINVETENEEEAGEIIKGSFEKYLRGGK